LADAAGPSLLSGLNDAQREAALALVGTVRILAGAGTGKTRTITHRIAYGIRMGVYDPSRVLALTFTTKAAGEMRERLRALGAPSVQARTFHAAALSQLSYFWPHTIGGTAPRILGGKSRLVADAAQRIGLRVSPSAVRDLAGEIEWRKVSELSLEAYAAAAAAGRALPEGVDVEHAVALQQAYEDLKDEQSRMDFEDVLLATAGMLELEPWVTQRVRQQYRFFVVDEFQDVSPLQHRLLGLWLGERRELCVVGDAAQTIYSFTGARSSYLTEFDRRYPDARTVRLEGNYRSTRSIIALANAVSREIPHSLELEPAATSAAVTSSASAAAPGASPAAGRAGARGDRRPDLTAFERDEEEARTVAARIRAEIEGGAAPSSIAVLFRTNVQSAPFEAALQDAGIPFAVAGAKRFFERVEVRQALVALRAEAVQRDDRLPLFQSVSNVLRDLGWSQEPPASTGAVRERWNALDALMRLADGQPEGVTLQEFVAELAHRATMNADPDLRAVTLTTVHAAKGLEWDCVHLAGLADGLLPISYARTPDAVEEERRLFYVAVTRARRTLRLSYARGGGQREGERAPSRFLAGLDSRTLDGIDGAWRADRPTGR